MASGSSGGSMPVAYAGPMTLPSPAEPDALRPAVADALAAWSARVARRARPDGPLPGGGGPCRLLQPDRAPVPVRSRTRALDAVGRVLESLARPGETWLDVGAGGGRYALPIARLTRRVIAVDPSAAMLDTLRSGMTDAGIDNVDVIEGRWPPAAGRRMRRPRRIARGCRPHGPRRLRHRGHRAVPGCAGGRGRPAVRRGHG